MPITLTKGFAGTRQMQYKIWIVNEETFVGNLVYDGQSLLQYVRDGIVDYVSPINEFYGWALQGLNDLISTEEFNPVGEVTADGYSLTSSDGTIIEGNNAGEVVLNKEYVFSAELINCTLANINAINTVFAGTRCWILLEEIDGRSGYDFVDGNGDPILSNDIHNLILIGGIDGMMINASESVKSKDVYRINLTGKSSISDLNAIRLIWDMPYDLPNQ